MTQVIRATHGLNGGLKLSKEQLRIVYQRQLEQADGISGPQTPPPEVDMVQAVPSSGSKILDLWKMCIDNFSCRQSHDEEECDPMIAVGLMKKTLISANKKEDSYYDFVNLATHKTRPVLGGGRNVAFTPNHKNLMTFEIDKESGAWFNDLRNYGLLVQCFDSDLLHNEILGHARFNLALAIKASMEADTPSTGGVYSTDGSKGKSASLLELAEANKVAVAGAKDSKRSRNGAGFNVALKLDHTFRGSVNMKIWCEDKGSTWQINVEVMHALDLHTVAFTQEGFQFYPFIKRMISLTIYVVAWSIFWWLMEAEWDFADCGWFEIITISSVGYGDIAPTTNWARMANIVNMLLGIYVFSDGLLMLVDFLTEMQKRADQKYLQKKMRSRVVAVEKEENTSMEVKENTSLEVLYKEEDGKSPTEPKMANQEFPTHDDLDREYDATLVRGGSQIAMLAGSLNKSSESEIMAVKQEEKKISHLSDEELMEKVDARNLDHVYVGSLFWLTALAGVTFFWGYEGMYREAGSGDFSDFFNVLHFIFVTMTTVGYGDLYPETRVSRWMCLLFVLISVSLLAKLISTAIDWRLNKIQEEKQAVALNQTLNSYAELEDFDGNEFGNNDGQVDKYEFLAVNLTKQNLVSADDIRLIAARFAALDVDNSGFLDERDFVPNAGGKKPKKATTDHRQATIK